MRFTHLHHLAIICSDYQTSKTFYIEILGGQIINETYRAERNSYKLDLKIADVQIELFSFPKPPKRITNPEAQGLRHIAFAVTSMADAVRELESKGITTESIRIDPITNKKFTFFKDPDDLPIELYEDS